MKSHLSVAVRESKRWTVVTIEGELDLGSAGAVERAVSQLRPPPPPTVVLDLGKLEFIDMSGLRVLIAARKQAKDEGQELVIANISDPVRRLLDLVSVDGLLPTLDEELE